MVSEQVTAGGHSRSATYCVYISESAAAVVAPLLSGTALAQQNLLVRPLTGQDKFVATVARNSHLKMVDGKLRQKQRIHTKEHQFPRYSSTRTRKQGPPNVSAIEESKLSPQNLRAL